jgi:hypothetical protein
MRIIRALTKAFRRFRAYWFGANISIEGMIRVSGIPRDQRLQIDVAHQEMRKEAARLLGIEHYEFSVGDEQHIGTMAVRPGMWLGTKRKLRIVSKDHITGTFYCRSYYSVPIGSDDGRRKLKLEIKAKGLLPWSPFTHY